MAEEKNPEPGAVATDPELGAAPETDPSATDPASEAASAAGAALTPGQRLAAKKAQKALEKREFKDELRRREEEKRQQEQAEADRLLGRAQPEPALPASVERVAGSFTHTVQDHRGRIVGAVVGALAIALAVLGVQRFMRSGAAEQAAQLTRALELANAPIDANDTDGQTDDGKPLFKSEQERATKALAAFEGAAKGAEDALAAWSELGAAATQVELGKLDAARSRFQAVYDAHAGEPAIAARALEGVVVAHEVSGKQDEALKTLEKLKAIEGSKELAELHIARIKLAHGDRDGAKGMLKALYDQLSSPSEGSAPSGYVKSEVEVRLAELDSTLVDKGSVGDQPQQFSEEQIQRLLEQLQRQQGQGKPGAGGE